jgi:hypothetical protein
VLIANGKSAQGNKAVGRIIDRMDFVVRFNYFKIRGSAAAAALGSRTDLWFLSEMKRPAAREFDKTIHPRQYVIPVAIPARLGCSKKALKKCTVLPAERRAWNTRGRRLKNLYCGKLKLRPDSFRVVPLEVLETLRQKYGFFSMWPSTGLLGILYVLHSYPDAKVYLHGYDFTRAKKSDCPEEAVRRREGKASARTYICRSSALGHFWETHKKSGTVHNLFAEGEVIRRLSKDGKIAVLKATSPTS